LLWLHCRPRRECGKKHPATRLAGAGPDGAIVEPKRGAWAIGWVTFGGETRSRWAL